MYKIEVTYDTGDTFHQEHDVRSVVDELEWKSLTKAKKALKDIENHYKCYMMEKKEWNAGKEDKEKARKTAMRSKWCSNTSNSGMERDYWHYSLMLEGDDGVRKNVYCNWVGYFESLVGAEVIDSDEDRKFKFRDW